MNPLIDQLNANDLVHISFLESDAEFIFYRGHFNALPQDLLPQIHTIYCLQNRLDQLYDYVMKIPELAWDLLEFAEKPLAVNFDSWKEHLKKEGVNVFVLHLPNKELATLRCKNLFLIRLNQEKRGLMPKVKTLTLPKADFLHFIPYRWISLKPDGEISMKDARQYDEFI